MLTLMMVPMLQLKCAGRVRHACQQQQAEAPMSDCVLTLMMGPVFQLELPRTMTTGMSRAPSVAAYLQQGGLRESAAGCLARLGAPETPEPYTFVSVVVSHDSRPRLSAIAADEG